VECEPLGRGLGPVLVGCLPRHAGDVGRGDLDLEGAAFRPGQLQEVLHQGERGTDRVACPVHAPELLLRERPHDPLLQQLEVAAGRPERILHVVAEAAHEPRATLRDPRKLLATALRQHAQAARLVERPLHLAGEAPLTPGEPGDQKGGEDRNEPEHEGDRAVEPRPPRLGGDLLLREALQLRVQRGHAGDHGVLQEGELRQGGQVRLDSGAGLRQLELHGVPLRRQRLEHIQVRHRGRAHPRDQHPQLLQGVVFGLPRGVEPGEVGIVIRQEVRARRRGPPLHREGEVAQRVRCRHHRPGERFHRGRRPLQEEGGGDRQPDQREHHEGVRGDRQPGGHPGAPARIGLVRGLAGLCRGAA
jgi:hypothetical protein